MSGHLKRGTLVRINRAGLDFDGREGIVEGSTRMYSGAYTYDVALGDEATWAYNGSWRFRRDQLTVLPTPSRMGMTGEAGS